MAYAVYISDALVCGSKASNTSDRSYLLFTRDAGMLWASARSVREERSKHRHALQEFSLVRISLVRGKGGWRVTGSEPIRNLYWGADDRSQRILMRDTVRLLRRFFHGETPVPALYDDIIEALAATVPDRTAYLTVVTLRTLHQLGYIDPEGALRPLLDAAHANDALRAFTAEAAEESARAIEHALSVSHL